MRVEKREEGVKSESDCGCMLYEGAEQGEGKRKGRGIGKEEKVIVGVYM